MSIIFVWKLVYSEGGERMDNVQEKAQLNCINRDEEQQQQQLQNTLNQTILYPFCVVIDLLWHFFKLVVRIR